MNKDVHYNDNNLTIVVNKILEFAVDTFCQSDAKKVSVVCLGTCEQTLMGKHNVSCGRQPNVVY